MPSINQVLLAVKNKQVVTLYGDPVVVDIFNSELPMVKLSSGGGYSLCSNDCSKVKISEEIVIEKTLDEILCDLEGKKTRSSARLNQSRLF